MLQNLQVYIFKWQDQPPPTYSLLHIETGSREIRSWSLRLSTVFNICVLSILPLGSWSEADPSFQASKLLSRSLSVIPLLVRMIMQRFWVNSLDGRNKVNESEQLTWKVDQSRTWTNSRMLISNYRCKDFLLQLTRPKSASKYIAFFSRIFRAKFYRTK